MTRMTPKTIANEAMSVSRASAPAPGRARSSTPKRTEAAPASMIQPSPWISLRRRIAVTISTTPVKMDQKARYQRIEIAIIPGDQNVRTPTATPSSPCSSRTHQSLCCLDAENAATMAKIPPTRAQAPKKMTRVASVSPGHAKAMQPKRIAARPRTRKTHQFLESSLSMAPPPSL